MTSHRTRPGVTLVELMLFITLMAVASGAVLGFLLLTADARVRQSSRADVQQVAVQLHQMLSYELRSAERVLFPPRAATGTTLALQVGVQDGSPLVLTTNSGVLLLVRGANGYLITPEDITVTAMRVTNLSSADGTPAVQLHLALQKRIPLAQQEYATATVDLGVAPLPTDDPLGDDCGCAAPSCADGQLTWQTCIAQSCGVVSDIPVSCP